MRKPAIYTPEGRQGWWGGPDTRPRCFDCDRVAFADRDAAQAAADKVTARQPAEPFHPFRCRAGAWHVGPRRRRSH